MMTLSVSQTLGTYSRAMCESQSTSFGDNEVDLCGRKLATLEEDLVMSFNADQDPNENHPVASLCEQTFNVDLEMPVSGHEHTSYYKQMKTKNVGGQFLYGSEMTAPNRSQVPFPNQIITSSSEQTRCVNQQSTLTPETTFYGGLMKAANG